MHVPILARKDLDADVNTHAHAPRARARTHTHTHTYTQVEYIETEEQLRTALHEVTNPGP